MFRGIFIFTQTSEIKLLDKPIKYCIIKMQMICKYKQVANENELHFRWE